MRRNPIRASWRITRSMRAGFLGVLVLVGLVAAGCGAATQQAMPVAAHHSVAATAFMKRNATQAAGSPVVVSGKTGVSLRPVPGATFGLMLVLKNQTHRQLTLEDVRAVVPHGSFVRQLGTHLAPYFQCKPYCPRHIVMKGPFGVEQPALLHVRPLTSAQAQLNFAFAGCGALQTAAKTPITRAVVIYRDTHGTIFRQTIALDSSQLDLHLSGPIACGL
jgi:hypothetical protein